MNKRKEIKCVMCGLLPEQRVTSETGELVKIYFIAPQTKEVLCQKCNINNDSLAMDKGDLRKGKLKIIKVPSEKMKNGN